MWTNPNDSAMTALLKKNRTIAMIGASDNPERDSHRVMKVMQARGFRVIPVNPVLAGQTLLGEPVFASLEAIEEPIDVVDVFRRSDAVPEIVDACLKRPPAVLWLQLGVIHEAAAERAAAAGITVVMDRCIKIEVLRLNVSHPAP